MWSKLLYKIVIFKENVHLYYLRKMLKTRLFWDIGIIFCEQYIFIIYQTMNISLLQDTTLFDNYKHKEGTSNNDDRKLGSIFEFLCSYILHPAILQISLMCNGFQIEVCASLDNDFQSCCSFHEYLLHHDWNHDTLSKCPWVMLQLWPFHSVHWFQYQIFGKVFQC